MKRTIRSTLETLSRLIPMGLYPHLVRRDLIDFFYHAVSDEPMPHVRHLYPVVPVADFERALLDLKASYTFVDYAQVEAHIFAGSPLPPKAVHLSFDDGYAECFWVVRPLLLKHEIPCTFFLTTSLIDNQVLFYRNKQSLCVERLLEPNFDWPGFAQAFLPALPILRPAATLMEFITWLKDLRLPDEPLIDEICRVLGVDWQAFLAERQPYLSTAQIYQMRAEGFTFGAHTCTHRKLIDLTKAEIEAEIVDSCRIVAEISDEGQVPFSFPHSAWGLDRAHLADLRARHPEIGLLFDTKGLRRDEKFIHNRIWAERRGVRQIHHHLREAYQEAWVDSVLGLGQRYRAHPGGKPGIVDG